jgi:hypothetical protein
MPFVRPGIGFSATGHNVGGAPDPPALTNAVVGHLVMNAVAAIRSLCAHYAVSVKGGCVGLDDHTGHLPEHTVPQSGVPSATRNAEVVGEAVPHWGERRSTRKP